MPGCDIMTKKLINYFAKIIFIIKMFFVNLFKRQKDIDSEENPNDTSSNHQKKIPYLTKISKNTIIENKEKPKIKIKENIEFVSAIGMTFYKDKFGQIIILKIEKNSAAHKLGLQKDDIITKINNEDTKKISLQKFEKIIKNKEKNIVLTCKDKTIFINQKEDKIQKNHYIKNIEPQSNIKKYKVIPITKTSKIESEEFIKKDKTKPKTIKIYILPKQTTSVIKKDIDVIKKAKPQAIPVIKKGIDNISHSKPQSIPEIKEEIEKIKKDKKIETQKTNEIVKNEEEPQTEAFLLNKFIEEDIKEKELKVLQNQNNTKTISELINENYKTPIIPFSLLLFRYRIVKNFFSMVLLSNSLTVALNTFNKNQNYYIPNYLNFLSKKRTLEETEFLTLKNINLVNELKENILETYNKNTYTNPELVTILNRLNEIHQDLTIRYKNQLDKKKQKVKRKVKDQSIN